MLAMSMKSRDVIFIGSGKTNSIKSTPFSRYASSKEGVAIIQAMAKIQSLAVRRHLISLAENLART
jgi:hypothetical protein